MATKWLRSPTPAGLLLFATLRGNDLRLYDSGIVELIEIRPAIRAARFWCLRSMLIRQDREKRGAIEGPIRIPLRS